MTDSTATQAPNRLDWRALSLAAGGRSLIEASAGTGKTWTIAALYLRFLLEREFTPRQIVVATFTNAAAAELKQRLRERIQDAHTLATAAVPAFTQTDAVHGWLQDHWRGGDTARKADATRLALALAEMDFAPICTLHSLCLRILGDHPFAAGAEFATPKMIDAKPLLIDIGNDLWRLLHADPGPGDVFDDASAAVRELAVFAREILAGNKREKVLEKLLLPGVVVPCDHAGNPWPDGWAEHVKALANRPNTWATKAVAARVLQQLAQIAGNKGWRGAISQEDTKTFFKNAVDGTGLLKGVADTDPIREQIQRIAAHLENLRWRSYAAIQTWARGQRERRLQAAEQLGFDDVLTRVRDGLQADTDGERTLADALFAAWPVALIDEFQDTDSIQYAIVKSILSQADGRPRGRLVLIGDPKQAIYSFRGGDIDTYKRAKQDVPESDHLTLQINFRSSTAFVGAINTLYQWMGHALSANESGTQISYGDATAAADSQRDSAWPNPALVLYAGGEGDDEFDAMKSCANVIAKLLDPASGRTLDGCAVQAADVAVLVPNNNQVARMVGLLHERGVPCVNRGRASVFAGATARELLLVLDAVEHCDNPRRIRAALGTRLLGWGYHRLRATPTDSPDWQTQVARFHDWQGYWRTRGVLAVTTELLGAVARTQLALHDGERTLTDLRHLGELLQKQERQLDGADELLAWLRNQHLHGGGEADAADSSALRLESDAACAQVMTLHMSKGLEFAFVFLPLLWKHGAVPSDGSPRLGSDGAGGRQLIFTTDAINKSRTKDQNERFRVLYVALTRARYACHLWLPPTDRTNRNSGDTTCAPLVTVAAKIRAKMEGVDATSGITVIDKWPQEETHLHAPSPCQGTLRARDLPAPRKGALPARYSFSTLAREPARRHGDAPDEHDDADISPRGEEAATSGARSRTTHPDLTDLQAVAGRAFGNAVHGIFEHRRIGMPLTEQLDLVLAQLDEYGVRLAPSHKQALAGRIATRLQAVLDADLDGNGLRLGQLSAHRLRTEMEFNFALAGVSLQALREACQIGGYRDLLPHGSNVLRGLMNGKIDLVFAHDGRYHVLDWKSSRIGDATAQCLEDYTPDALEATMDAERYRLQALLYTLALDRYLRTRLGPGYRREQHLGDCWYLFVRTVGLDLPDGTRCGVWRHRFDDALVDAMQAALATDRSAA